MKPEYKSIAKYIGLGAVILTTFVILLATGILPYVGAIFLVETTSCEYTPYDPDCVCELGIERKINVPWIGVPRWSCETLGELLIDPESTNFESESIAFAEEYLSRWCPTVYTDVCDGKICERYSPTYPNNACISASWGWSITGERIANIECVTVKEWSTPAGILTHEEALAVYGNEPNLDVRESSGNLPWRMQFYVESKTGLPTTMFPESNYVYNPTTGKKCAHSSYCEYVYANPEQYTIDNPGWCIGTLPLDVRPFTPDSAFLTMFGLAPQLGSGYPAAPQ